MKKFSLLVMISLLALSFIALPARAQDDAESKAYEEWYKAYQAKDYAQAARLAKEIKAKFPNHPNIKYIDASVTKYQGVLLGEFDTALRAYFAAPDAAKLDKTIATGDKYLGEVPDSFIVNFLAARATLNGIVASHYSDMAKLQSYSDKALSLSSGPTPAGLTEAEYKKNIDQIKAEFPLFLGLKHFNATPPDLAKAEEYFTSAASMKVATPGLGWKDYRIYWQRADIYNQRYGEASKEYNALTEEEKRGEKGKAILTEKINPLIDKMIVDFARVVAVATDAQFKTAAQDSLKQYWEYKYKKLDGMNELVAGLTADPTVEPTLEAWPAETTPPPTTLITKKPGLKVGTGTPAANGGGTTKGKAAPKGRKKK